jgi:hemoglobin
MLCDASFAGLPLRHRFHPLSEAILPRSATSLYQRMGGYDVIAGVIDDLFALLHGDPAFARFFGGRSEDSVVRSRQLLVDQMCALSGGPCFYIGRDMKTSHRGLGITTAEWETNSSVTATTSSRQTDSNQPWPWRAFHRTCLVCGGVVCGPSLRVDCRVLAGPAGVR